MFPRQTFKIDPNIIAAQLSDNSIKWGVKLQMFCESLVTFILGFNYTFPIFLCRKYLECPCKVQVAPLIVKDFILASYIIFYVIKSIDF